MASHGGARNRSGPGKDLSSLRSADLKLVQLPADGFDGDVPEFPLPRMLRYRWEFEDKRKFQVVDDDATGMVRDRELALWDQVWRTPQAAAWYTQPWRWTIVAEYCRLKTVVEMEPDAKAALVAQLHRYRDQLGLTPAGLKENGWAIVAAAEAPRLAPVKEMPKRRSRDRFRADGGS